MAYYSVWSAVVALILMLFALWTQTTDKPASDETLYFMVLALFHGIFSIWFWQGRQLPQFIHSTIYSRLLLGCVYWFFAWQTSKWGGPLNLSTSIVDAYIAYLVIQGSVDIISAAATAVLINKNYASLGSEKSLNSKPTLEIKNRFSFALYMIFLGAWILYNTDSFLAFFYLPATEFPGWNGAPPYVPGPIHIVGMLVLLLAAYNFIAVKFRLTQLITAGVKGGLFTCLFVLLLVATEVLHPITLLIPAVDLISVGVVLFYRVLRWENKA